MPFPDAPQTWLDQLHVHWPCRRRVLRWGVWYLLHHTCHGVGLEGVHLHTWLMLRNTCQCGFGVEGSCKRSLRKAYVWLWVGGSMLTYRALAHTVGKTRSHVWLRVSQICFQKAFVAFKSWLSASWGFEFPANNRSKAKSISMTGTVHMIQAIFATCNLITSMANTPSDAGLRFWHYFFHERDITRSFLRRTYKAYVRSS